MMRQLPKEIRLALARLEPQVQKAFLDAIQEIRRVSDPAMIARLIEQGNIDAAVRAIRFEPTLFGDLDRALEEAFRAGGIGVISALPIIKDPFDGGRVVFGFNGRHPRAEAWAKKTSSRMVVELLEDQRQMAREVILRSVQQGRAPRNAALDLVGRINRTTGQREGGFIGLTKQQASWVDNARQELVEGRYKDFLSRKVRPTRYDRMILRALRDDKPLSEVDIDRIKRDYTNNMLRYRGETISRTETLNAYRAGRAEGFNQLIDTGAVRDDQVIRRWRATGDSRTRDSHVDMDGREVIGLRTPWELPTGTVMYPGDPNGTAAGEDTIQCRCYEEFEIRYEAVD